MNRTLAELARAMIFSTKTPTFLWPEATTHTAYLRNRTHTWALESKTPLEVWCGCKPDVSHLQEFGSPVWILTEGQLSKFQPRSKEHTFMGFVDGPKAIKYYDASTRQVHISRNFRFPSTPQTQPNNTTTPLQSTSAQSEGEATAVPNGTVSDMSTHPYESSAESYKRKRTTDEMLEDDVRKSQRQRCTHDYHLLDDPWADEPETSEREASKTSAERVYATSSEHNVAPDNPKTLSEARRSSDWPDWEKAVQAELDQLHKMGTWELVDPPEECTPITNKWVLTKKYDKDGNLQKYKARLVTRGYSQQPGMDYTDTFSPVVRLETI